MSECCSPCDTVPPTQIPGAPGTDGAPGAAGAPGGNSWTLLTVANAVPANTATPTIYQVGDSRWAGIGQVVVFEGPSHYSVVSKPSISSIELLWLDYPGDVAATTAIAVGALLSPSGVIFTIGALPTAVDYSALTTAGAVDNVAVANGVGISTLVIPLTSLATGLGALAIDLLTGYVPGYRFKLLSFDFVTTIVGAGAGASQVFNLEIGATNTTGGVLTVTLASTDTIGEVTTGTPITAANVGTAAEAISLEMAAGGTVFTSGSGYFLIKIQNLDSADAIASLSDHINDLITAL